MRTMIRMACALAALALASGSAAAQELYAGELESIKDTEGGGCGQSLGEHQFFIYRPKGEGMNHAGMLVSFTGVTALVQNADESGEFFTDGTKGKMTGTIVFSTGGPEPGSWATQGTMKGGKYTLNADSTDPEMIKINKMTVNFTIKETGAACSFVWNGVMTPALMPGG